MAQHSSQALSGLPVGETTPGDSREIEWEVVARMPGLAPAQILGGRLQSEGIPVRVWQEGAGQALGLTVGRLGTGYVMVPVEFAQQAREILSEADDFSDEEE